MSFGIPEAIALLTAIASTAAAIGSSSEASDAESANIKFEEEKKQIAKMDQQKALEKRRREALARAVGSNPNQFPDDPRPEATLQRSKSGPWGIIGGVSQGVGALGSSLGNFSSGNSVFGIAPNTNIDSGVTGGV